MSTLPQWTKQDQRAIEQDFPIGLVSQLAAHESWRKEVYRPLAYIHKWWARRLGSVFRAILIASAVDASQDVPRLFWQQVKLPNVVVFDPFMGSGTTIYEALKLGCRVIGRDINPVAFTMVKAALQPVSLAAVQATFAALERSAGEAIRSFYIWTSPTGERGDVLYYYWVKVVPCPNCGEKVDLFKSRIFVKHAYPRKYPAAHSICPTCGAINGVRYDATTCRCQQCGTAYNPQAGNVHRSIVTCPTCQSHFTALKAVRQTGAPPEERMYAKMVLCPDGTKAMLSLDEADIASYQRAQEMLPDLWAHIPQIHIEPGYNTKQILNYHYHTWDQLFNARQLAAMALLSAEIAQIEPREVRELFACLFSGVLEFNNMFASFKGIGTGAVRHMFAHHILKPELTPLEANPWGTEKSSGSFRTLYESRILRALAYKARPFELRLVSNRVSNRGKLTSRKVYGLSEPLESTIAPTYPAFAAGERVYLSAGDSAHTDIAEASVDLIVTDPPFFDNVHYSELADFFYVWLRAILGPHDRTTPFTTRSPHEVQSADSVAFTARLASVFTECHRVLKDDGLLVFTFHHARHEGWIALYRALRDAGFWVYRAHPVKAEMAVSIPLQQAGSPVSFDLVLVCRKTRPPTSHRESMSISPIACLDEARGAIAELHGAALDVSISDAKVIITGCLLSRLAHLGNLERELAALSTLDGQVDSLAVDLVSSAASKSTSMQLALWD